MKSENIENAGRPEEEYPSFGEGFEVLALVGRGGMGSVYKVRDLKLDRVICIKVLQAELTSDRAALKRFEQEAEAASHLDHPSLVTTFGFGTTDDGLPYIMMDYFEGVSLAEVLKAEGLLKPERAFSIFAEICHALDHAHSKDVIHRDIKPNNILIGRGDNGEERVKVVDFGIAKVMPQANRETHNLTETGEVFGSPHYMSPEQCLGFMLDARSDIYSLGCLLYELLTGDPPFGGANPIQVVVKHINEEIEPFPSSLKRQKLAGRLESVVMRCLEKDQVNRYQNVGDLIKDLVLVSQGKQPSKYKKTVKQKREFTKRQMIGTVVGGVAVLFYAVVSATYFNQAGVATILMVSVLNLLVLGGIYVSFSSFLDQLRNTIDWKNTASGWWLSLISLSFGVTCSTVLPFTAVAGFMALWAVLLNFKGAPGGSFSDFPDWMKVLGVIDFYVHLASLLLVVIGACGLFFWRGNRKIGFGDFLTRSICIFAVLAFLTVVVVPKEVAKLCLGVANLSCEYLPTAGRTLAGFSVALNSEDESAVRTLAYLENKAGNKTRAIDVLERAIKQTPNNSNFQYDSCVLLMEDGKFDRAMKRAEKYDNLNRKAESSKGLVLKARVYESKGDYKRALELYRQAQDGKHNWSTETCFDQARMLCALNRYDEARKVCQNHLEVDHTNDGNVRFLSAVLTEKLKGKQEALPIYRQVADSYRHNGFLGATSEYRPMGFYKAEQRANALVQAYALSKVENTSLEQDRLKTAEPLTREDLLSNQVFVHTGLKPSW